MYVIDIVQGCTYNISTKKKKSTLKKQNVFIDLTMALYNDVQQFPHILVKLLSET